METAQYIIELPVLEPVHIAYIVLAVWYAVAFIVVQFIPVGGHDAADRAVARFVIWIASPVLLFLGAIFGLVDLLFSWGRTVKEETGERRDDFKV